MITALRWEIRWRYTYPPAVTPGPGDHDGQWLCGYCSTPAPARRCTGCGREFW